MVKKTSRTVQQLITELHNKHRIDEMTKKYVFVKYQTEVISQRYN